MDFLLEKADFILLDENTIHGHIRDEVGEQGRELYPEEIRPDQETSEIRPESTSIGQEDMSAYGTDVIPEAQAGEMQLNNSSDREVIIGASPGYPFNMDDTLPW